MASDGSQSGCCAAPRPLHSAQAVDVASASNFRVFEMLHLHLDLRAEFGPPGPGPGSRNLSGTAVLELRCLVPEGATELRLDSHPCLEVAAVALRRRRPGAEEQPAEPVPFRTQPFSHYGHALCVALPQPCPAGERFQVLLTYRVGEGPGVCWLAPEQTAGKKKPFVYTQGQAVLNRAFFPCFDTPAVKCRYSALVEVPDGFTAVMSANTWEKRGPNKFFFQMCHPIPSYLIALAIGDLVAAEVGPRSRVWAEPCLIEAAKEEYNGVIEEFLAAGEKLFGPYVWGRCGIALTLMSFVHFPPLLLLVPLLLPLFPRAKLPIPRSQGKAGEKEEGISQASLIIAEEGTLREKVIEVIKASLPATMWRPGNTAGGPLSNHFSWLPKAATRSHFFL